MVEMQRGAGGNPSVNPSCIPAVMLWIIFFFYIFFLQTPIFQKKRGSVGWGGGCFNQGRVPWGLAAVPASWDLSLRRGG